MGESIAEVAAIAAKLTKAQCEELLHYEEGEGYMPPANARRAYRLWLGICPGRRIEPVFLLTRAHGRCLYKPSQLGNAIRNHLEATDHAR